MDTVLSPSAYYILNGVLVAFILIGLSLMSRVSKARAGNALCTVSAAAAIILAMYNYRILTAPIVWTAIAVGIIMGIICATKVKMIEMPQTVALLNGLGGLSSALVALVSANQTPDIFAYKVAVLALIVGFVTFTGSIVAAGKLSKLLPQKPVVWKWHTAIITVVLIALLICIIFDAPLTATSILAAFFGIAFAVRVGGADMPITISLLNSLSGVAAGIAGIAVSDMMLVSVGGIVGASGLLLTQIMCKAMNRSLIAILIGSTSAKTTQQVSKTEAAAEADIPAAENIKEKPQPGEILKNAKKVIIIPGYGMALAQAQSKVKQLADKLEEQGKEVKYAIHPVAGRMPGHMNVLLCEVDVPYDKLYEMETINTEFAECDAVVIVGANDVVNPAANTAEGTPIYGMPVLNAADAGNVIVCNFDEKPGYAGVPNPLYKNNKTILLLGDAKETVAGLIEAF